MIILKSPHGNARESLCHEEKMSCGSGEEWGDLWSAVETWDWGHRWPRVRNGRDDSPKPKGLVAGVHGKFVCVINKLSEGISILWYAYLVKIFFVKKYITN